MMMIRFLGFKELKSIIGQVRSRKNFICKLTEASFNHLYVLRHLALARAVLAEQAAAHGANVAAVSACAAVVAGQLLIKNKDG
jgi:hypothetical protein